MLDNDMGEDPLTVTLVSGTSHGALQFEADGTFAYTPQPAYAGPDQFRYQISDGIATAEAWVYITVDNDVPVAHDDYFYVWHDTVANFSGFSVLDNDWDMDPLTVTRVSTTSNGTLQFEADGGEGKGSGLVSRSSPGRRFAPDEWAKGSGLAHQAYFDARKSYGDAQRELQQLKDDIHRVESAYDLASITGDQWNGPELRRQLIELHKRRDHLQELTSTMRELEIHYAKISAVRPYEREEPLDLSQVDVGGVTLDFTKPVTQSDLNVLTIWGMAHRVDAAKHLDPLWSRLLQDARQGPMYVLDFGYQGEDGFKILFDSGAGLPTVGLHGTSTTASSPRQSPSLDHLRLRSFIGAHSASAAPCPGPGICGSGCCPGHPGDELGRLITRPVINSRGQIVQSGSGFSGNEGVYRAVWAGVASETKLVQDVTMPRVQETAVGQFAFTKFTVSVLPIVGTTVMVLEWEDPAGDMALQALGDLSFGAGKMLTAAKAGSKAATVAGTALKGTAGIQMAIGTAAAGQAITLFIEGDTAGGAGKAGLALMTLFGGSVDAAAAFNRLHMDAAARLRHAPDDLSRTANTPGGGSRPQTPPVDNRPTPGKNTVGVQTNVPVGAQPRTVFRGERSSRTPVKVFEEGIPPKGTNADLEAHVAANLKDSNFVATSIRPAIAKGFAGKNGWVYVIRTEKGIDVNATLGAKSPFREQFEVAIPGGVLEAEVMGAFPMKNGEIVGEFVRNPNYKPR